MGLLIEDGSTLLMVGDSITDCERARPVGDTLFKLGNGYVAVLAGLLRALCPERRIRVVNVGVGGNTVRDLAARWQGDVLDLAPDWVSVMIGINDVWREIDRPLRQDLRVGLAEFERTLDGVVAETLPRVKGVILMTPYFLEPNREDAMRALMDRYGTAVEDVAARHGLICVDAQAAFDRLMAHHHPMELAWDRVHAHLPAHVVLAVEMAKAIGLEW